MLKAAQLYQSELYQKSLEIWYDPKYIYWSADVCNLVINPVMDDNGNFHSFVSVNKDNEVIGYIQYAINWNTMSAMNLGIMSFDIGNIEFIKDVYEAVENIFIKYHLNRLTFYSVADNPAIKGYRKLIEKYGGKECGYYRQSVRLQDGKIHDEVLFEILAEEFFSQKL